LMLCDWCNEPVSTDANPTLRCGRCSGTHWRCAVCERGWADGKTHCSVCGIQHDATLTAMPATAQHPSLDPREFNSNFRDLLELGSAEGYWVAGRSILCARHGVMVSPPLNGQTLLLRSEGVLSVPVFLDGR